MSDQASKLNFYSRLLSEIDTKLAGRNRRILSGDLSSVLVETECLVESILNRGDTFKPHSLEGMDISEDALLITEIALQFYVRSKESYIDDEEERDAQMGLNF